MNFIFESLNQCTGTLPGPEASTFIYQRYTVFGHLRAFKNAFASGAWQLSLKCSKDDRICFIPCSIARSLISSVSWASPLKIVYTPLQRAEYNKRSIPDLFLRIRSERTNDRQLMIEANEPSPNPRGFGGDLFLFLALKLHSL